MYKACSRCGRIHEVKFRCTVNKPKIDYSVYGDQEERKLRSTTAWRKKSEDIRTRAQFLCEVCRDKGLYTYDNLEVHHIVKLRDNADGLLDDNNLVCLCAVHHRQADAGEIDADYLRQLAEKRETRSR